jgi:hypothetical protein
MSKAHRDRFHVGWEMSLFHARCVTLGKRRSSGCSGCDLSEAHGTATGIRGDSIYPHTKLGGKHLLVLLNWLPSGQGSDVQPLDSVCALVSVAVKNH